MKWLLMLLAVSVVFVAMPAMAQDGNNVWDQAGDVLSGKGNTYAGVEVIKDDLIKPLGIPLGVKVWTDFMVGEIDEDVPRDVRGGVRLRIKL